MKIKDLFEERSMIAGHEDFLHHIAEEELIACKVFEIKDMPGNVVAFICDCNDNKRKPGYQEDLSKKLAARLVLHPQLALITPKVYHKNIDTR